VQGPFGRFVLDQERAAVFIAGGIGITPLKGMAEYASDVALPIEVRLLYSNSRKEEIPFRNELDELERGNPRFRVLHTLTGNDVAPGWDGLVGRIGERHLLEAARGLKPPVYYVSGKPEMVATAVNVLADLLVPEADIRVELFRGY